MNAILVQAEAALRDHPDPALRIGELLELVRGSDRTMSAARLRALLEDHPTVFRVFEPWRGPWRRRDDRRAAPTGEEEAWVVLVSDPTGGRDNPAHLTRLRESVRWLSRGVDPRSASDLGRWHAIVLAERAIRRKVGRDAA